MSQAQIQLKRAARLLTVLGDSTRLRVLRLLRRQELCVCELVDALRMPQYKVSRHLRGLRAAGLVEARRQGRWMHYGIGRPVASNGFYRDLFKAIEGHLDEIPEVKKDHARLSRRLALRRSGQCVVGKTAC